MSKILGSISIIIAVSLLAILLGLIYASARDWKGFAEGRELRLAGAMALFGGGGLVLLIVGIGLTQSRSENR